MHFLGMIFAENYWFISQIFKLFVILIYISTVFLFGRFLFEITVAAEKFFKDIKKVLKNSNEKDDKNGSRFV